MPQLATVWPHTDSCWSGAGSVQSTAGLKAFDFGTNHLRNESQTASLLTLSGLVAHSSMTLTFDLAMWDSIDYHDSYLDIFQVSVDGSFLYDNYFGNYCGTPIATYGNSTGPGTPLTPDFTGYYTVDYGYGTFRDSARHVACTFNHSASSVVFAFLYPNSQGGVDESFGLDNVTVSVDAALEPRICAPVLIPSGPANLAGISGEIRGGPPNGIAILQASPVLGQPDSWRDIGTIQLDANGRGRFSSIQDPQSMRLLNDFFRVRFPQ